MLANQKATNTVDTARRRLFSLFNLNTKSPPRKEFLNRSFLGRGCNANTQKRLHLANIHIYVTD